VNKISTGTSRLTINFEAGREPKWLEIHPRNDCSTCNTDRLGRVQVWKDGLKVGNLVPTDKRIKYDIRAGSLRPSHELKLLWNPKWKTGFNLCEIQVWDDSGNVVTQVNAAAGAKYFSEARDAIDGDPSTCFWASHLYQGDNFWRADLLNRPKKISITPVMVDGRIQERGRLEGVRIVLDDEPLFTLPALTGPTTFTLVNGQWREESHTIEFRSPASELADNNFAICEFVLSDSTYEALNIVENSAVHSKMYSGSGPITAAHDGSSNDQKWTNCASLDKNAPNSFMKFRYIGEAVRIGVMPRDDCGSLARICAARVGNVKVLIDGVEKFKLRPSLQHQNYIRNGAGGWTRECQVSHMTCVHNDDCCDGLSCTVQGIGPRLCKPAPILAPILAPVAASVLAPVSAPVPAPGCKSPGVECSSNSECCNQGSCSARGPMGKQSCP